MLYFLPWLLLYLFCGAGYVVLWLDVASTESLSIILLAANAIINLAAMIVLYIANRKKSPRMMTHGFVVLLVAITSFFIARAIEKSKMNSSVAKASTVITAVDKYYSDKGKYPSDLSLVHSLNQQDLRTSMGLFTTKMIQYKKNDEGDGYSLAIRSSVLAFAWYNSSDRRWFTFY